MTEGAGKDGKASRRGRATLDGDTEGNEDDKGDLEVISSASSKSSTGNDFNGDRHGGIDVNETLSKAPQVMVKSEGKYVLILKKYVIDTPYAKAPYGLFLP